MIYDVISFGSATLDVFVKTEALKVVGKTLSLPIGQKNEVNQLIITSGGGGTNTAVGFSRLGLKAAVVARCGWDLAGKIVRNDLKKEKVSDSLLAQVEDDQTDYSTILISNEGESTILVYRGGSFLEASLVPFKKLNSRWFCISGLEGNFDLLEKLIKFALKNKIKVCLNPGKRELTKKRLLLSIFKQIEVVILNEDEATQMTDRPKLLCPEGIVIVTRGNKGAYLFDQPGNRLIAEAFKIEATNFTGAGDAFTCGFLTGLIKNWDLEKSLKLGLANGASVVTEIGAKTGLLSLSTYHNWLNKPLKMEWKKINAKNR